MSYDKDIEWFPNEGSDKEFKKIADEFKKNISGDRIMSPEDCLKESDFYDRLYGYKSSFICFEDFEDKIISGTKTKKQLKEDCNNFEKFRDEIINCIVIPHDSHVKAYNKLRMLTIFKDCKTTGKRKINLIRYKNKNLGDIIK